MNDNVIPIGNLDAILKQEKRLRANYEKRLTELHAKKITTVKATLFTCQCCNKESLFSELSFVQEQWYESPHGCMGGDMWHDSDTNVCHLLCPHCNTMNYINNHKQRELILKLICACGLSVNDIFTIVYKNSPRSGKPVDLTQIYPKKR